MIPFPYQRGQLGRRISSPPPLVSGQTTWNPSDRNANISLSNSNRRASSTASAVWQGVRGVSAKNSGSWYIEFDFVARGQELIVGVAQTGAATSGAINFAALGGNYFIMSIDSSNASSTWRNGAQVTSNTGTRSTGQRLGVSINFSSSQAIFYVNGSAVSTYNSFPAGSYLPYVCLFNTGGIMDIPAAQNHLPGGFSLWN